VIAGRYTLVREIGRGGAGVVHLGHDEVLDRHVAIKRMGLLPGTTEDDVARAEREARLAAGISHPHVVSILDLVKDEDCYWLVMEHVEGRTLTEVVVAEGALEPARAARILAQAADGLVEATRAGIVHRDVKPSNIMVDDQDHAKLGDFGIARSADDAALTRTGLVASVHTFARSEIAPPFLLFLVALLGASFGLVAWRWEDLRDPSPLVSLISREGAFLFNNVLFLAFAFAVLLGTLFPVLSEAVRGVQVFVGPPYFRQVTAPQGIALLLLMGIGVLLPWRRASGRALQRFRIPVACMLGTGIAAGLLLQRPGVVAALAVVAFAASATLQEYHRGAQARASLGYLRGLWQLFGDRRRRYGGYLAHLAVLVMAVGIVASHAYVQEREVTVRPGERFTVGRYEITYRGLRAGRAPNAEAAWGVLEVHDGSGWVELRPLRLYYPRWDQPVSRPAIRSTLRDDLYAVLAAFTPDGEATLRVWVNPMVRWIWIGGVAFVLGTLVAAWPEGRRGGVSRRIEPVRITPELPRPVEEVGS